MIRSTDYFYSLVLDTLAVHLRLMDLAPMLMVARRHHHLAPLPMQVEPQVQQAVSSDMQIHSLQVMQVMDLPNSGHTVKQKELNLDLPTVLQLTKPQLPLLTDTAVENQVY